MDEGPNVSENDQMYVFLINHNTAVLPLVEQIPYSKAIIPITALIFGVAFIRPDVAIVPT